ncbi:flagellar hook-basal body complex protein FliE [Streptomyces canus]|uniref:Flagellar hook-basal body complex protein FliE n=1 Tax=Streptomyces canus TaxID=58343 RepID=A0AAW8FBQ0_9ACTN|nr:flagellar hook-basal body complex protein FliE [Streptomyces canus]
MSAENLHGEGSAAAAEVRTGPRHAAPKKPLFNRFHMPAGKAIAMAAMPTAVLMGIGFTPTLALADDAPTAKSLTADEYKDCIAALDGASPSASASPSSSPDDSDGSATATPSPSASSGSGSDSGSNSGGSSSDSGSGDQATPTPTPSASASKEESSSSSGSSGSDTATASPPASASDDGNLLTDIGDAITGIFTGGSGDASSASPTPTPSASASKSADDSAGDTAKETTEKVTDTVKDTVKDTTDTASKAAEDTTKAVEDTTKAAEEAAADATASPSPSASSTTDAEDCPVATDEVGDTEPGVTVADNAWTLKASSLLLKGADYQGVVEVKTASGKTKKVLKYVISGGTDIGDLHQIVTERGKTYHVQAGKGTTSTIRDGKTTMYTESISGNLLGLIPVTFSPDSPPPLNIPLIYFTNVTVQQAAQYGGTLTVPGMHQYNEG